MVKITHKAIVPKTSKKDRLKNYELVELKFGCFWKLQEGDK
jgi:hypothetical protein